MLCLLTANLGPNISNGESELILVLCLLSPSLPPSLALSLSVIPLLTPLSLQWDLVCDKNYLVETSQSVFAFGVMVGAVMFTSLADKIGRKPVHLGCQYGMIVVGLAIAFAPEYVTFVVLRFVLGALREVS